MTRTVAMQRRLSDRSCLVGPWLRGQQFCSFATLQLCNLATLQLCNCNCKVAHEIREFPHPNFQNTHNGETRRRLRAGSVRVPLLPQAGAIARSGERSTGHPRSLPDQPDAQVAPVPSVHFQGEWTKPPWSAIGEFSCPRADLGRRGRRTFRQGSTVSSALVCTCVFRGVVR